METVVTNRAEITLTPTPTLEQMKIWWTEWQLDPARHFAYTDFLPKELDEFLEAMHQGDISVWMFLIRDGVTRRVGGGFYLHDMGADADGPYAWVGIYVLPPYRRYALRACAMVRRACERQGLCRFFVATRHSNRPVQMLLRHVGFTRLGIYPDWSYFNGTLDAAAIYTLRPEDQELAWAAAKKRADQFQSLVQAQGA
jgi:RimJ/RimL family protein N-acetyltransferase